MTNLPKKSKNAMLDGLSALLVLKLTDAPAAETIKAVAKVWEQALIVRGYAWDDEDAQRLGKAFVLYSSTKDRWPSPMHIIELMPPKKQIKNTLPEPVVEKMSPKTQKMLDQICAQYGVKRKSRKNEQVL